MPKKDSKEIGVAETAFVGNADILIRHHIDDFEGGPKTKPQTERLLTNENGKPAALVIRDPLRSDLLAAIQGIAVG